MAVSPSNSGILRSVNDTVTLERNPTHDAVGVQLHGDADGVELVFEGSMAGAYHALPAKALVDAIPQERNGRFSYIVSALHCTHVRARLVDLKAGSVNVALYSGNAASMETMATTHASDKAKPVKLGKQPAKPAERQPAKEPEKTAEAKPVEATKDPEPAKEPAKEPEKMPEKQQPAAAGKRGKEPGTR